MESFPVHAIYELEYPEFTAEISVLSSSHLQYEVKEGRFEYIEIVAYEAVKIREGVFIVSWQDKDKSTVVQIEDFINKKIYSYVTLPEKVFIRTIGKIRFISGMSLEAHG